MVLGVALGSLGAAAIGLCMALRGGHALLDVPYNMWPLLFADCMGIGLYGIMSALATRYLRGAEVAFLLLIDVIVAPLLACVVVPANAAMPGHYVMGSAADQLMVTAAPLPMRKG